MNIYEKLGIIQSKLKAPKGQYNSFGKYKYRSCEDILEAVKPLLAETKTVLCITDQMEVVGDRVYVRAETHLKDAEDSSSEIVTVAYAREEESKKGMDSSQVTGAASSYARKYALNGLFCIDDNKDSDSTNTGEKEKTSGRKAEPAKETEMISSETTMSIKNIIDKYPEAKLLEQIKTRFKVNDIKSLTKEKGQKCLKMLIDYDKQHTGKEQQYE
nr:MAG TPA: ERF superfamily protein [Caudoviricetes sp.]